MTAWLYRFLIMGVAFFGIPPASRHVNDDQPGLLNVHIRDYCDPSVSRRSVCVRTTTPVSAGVITFSGFQAELGAINPSGRGASFPIEPRLKRASASCSRISEGKHIHLRACENSVVDLSHH